MRFVFLMGGLLGFALAGLTSWMADCGPGRVFLDASIGCLVGGLLFRWLWSVLLHGLRETFVAKQRAALAAEAKTKN